MTGRTFLVNSSVVVVAGRNNPGMFTAEFLARNGVLADGDKVQEVTSSPAQSRVAFGEGYRFESSANRITLALQYQGELREAGGDDVLDRRLTDNASALAEAVAVVQPQSLGINFRLILVETSLRRLVKDGAVPATARPTQASFKLPGTSTEAPDLILTFTKAALDVVREQPMIIGGDGGGTESETGTGLVVDANYHHDFTPIASDYERAEAMGKRVRSRPQLLTELLASLDGFEL